jgi:hypothetical protein
VLVLERPGVVGRALPVALVVVLRERAAALGLEVVDDDRERRARPCADRLERLGQRLARIVERTGADQDLRRADGLHDLGLVDERRTDDVLALWHVGGRGHERPLGAPGSGVERADKRAKRRVAIRQAKGLRVLDLLQRDDICIESVDRRDDLGLLPCEVGSIGRTTRSVARTRVGRDRVALTVLVRRAAASRGDPVRRGRREVVEDVERADLDVAADPLRRGGPGAADHDRLVATCRELLRWLQPPGAVAVVEHDRVVEPHRRTDADLVVRRQPRQRNALVGGAQEVEAGAVIESHEPRVVLGLQSRCRSPRAYDVGRRRQRLVAVRETDLRVLVGRVVVGDREAPARLQQHALEGFALARAQREADGRRLDALGRTVDDLPAARRRAQLGEAVELADLAGHLDEVTAVDPSGERRGEHEDPVGGRVAAQVDGPAGAVGLHVRATEAAGLVDRRDDTGRDDVLACQRARGAVTLDLGDGLLDRWLDRCPVAVARVTARHRSRRSSGEVGAVVVGVGPLGAAIERARDTRAAALDCRLVRVGGAVADQVDEVGVREHRRRLA